MRLIDRIRVRHPSTVSAPIEEQVAAPARKPFVPVWRRRALGLVDGVEGVNKDLTGAARDE